MGIRGSLETQVARMEYFIKPCERPNSKELDFIIRMRALVGRIRECGAAKRASSTHKNTGRDNIIR